MNMKQRGVAALIRSAITGEKTELPEGFDLAEVLRTIRAHHIGALAYEGALKCGIDPQTPAMQQLFPYYCKAVQISKRQMRTLEQVFAAFEANGIDYLPVKGSIMKKLYPRPELRMMGDADVLIRVEQYEKIVPIMKEMGFSPDGEIEHHYAWKSDALEVELHKSLFSKKHDELVEHFGNGWSLAYCVKDHRYTMKSEDMFIYLFAHFSNHYRSSGVGCRHLVDLWVFLRAHPELDEAYVQSVLERLHLRKFYQNTRRLLRLWFEGGKEDDVIRMMSDFIFANGSWGTMTQATLSSDVRHTRWYSKVFGGRFAYIFRHIFPGVEDLRMRYPILKKALCLLPVVWVYHLINRTLFAKGVLKRQVHNIAVLSKENVDQYRQMLDAVGLGDLY